MSPVECESGVAETSVELVELGKSDTGTLRSTLYDRGSNRQGNEQEPVRRNASRRMALL